MANVTNRGSPEFNRFSQAVVYGNEICVTNVEKVDGGNTYNITIDYKGNDYTLIVNDDRVVNYWNYGGTEGQAKKVQEWAHETKGQLDKINKQFKNEHQFEVTQGKRDETNLSVKIRNIVTDINKGSSSRVIHAVRYLAGAIGLGEDKNLDIATGKMDKPIPERIARLTQREVKKADWVQITNDCQDSEAISSIPLSRMDELPKKEKGVAFMRLINAIGDDVEKLNKLQGVTLKLLNSVDEKYLDPKVKANFNAFKGDQMARILKGFVDENPENINNQAVFDNIMALADSNPEILTTINWEKLDTEDIQALTELKGINAKVIEFFEGLLKQRTPPPQE